MDARSATPPLENVTFSNGGCLFLGERELVSVRFLLDKQKKVDHKNLN